MPGRHAFGDPRPGAAILEIRDPVVVEVLESAVGGAAVATHGIAVVTLLAEIEDVIAAQVAVEKTAHRRDSH